MARQAMEAVGRAGLGSTPLWEGDEAASATYVNGAVLVNSSGFIAESSADGDNIVGVAVKAGGNGGSNGAKRARFVPALPHILFEANVDDSGDLGNGAYVDADMWKHYALAKDADGKWYIDKADTTNVRVCIVGISDPAARAAADAATARIQARVQFVFLGDKTNFDS